jgi:hypothetical protein
LAEVTDHAEAVADDGHAVRFEHPTPVGIIVGRP